MSSNLILGMYGLSKTSAHEPGYSSVLFEHALDTIQFAFESGITYVDTSPTYGLGNADALIIEARSFGCHFQVCSKVGLDVALHNFSSDLIVSQLDNIIKFHRNFISSISLHSPPSQILADSNLMLNILRLIHDRLGGSVRIGISLKSPSDILLIDHYKGINFIQSNLSWFDLRILDFQNILMRYEIQFRSIYGSGLIPLILSQIELTNRSANIFELGDVRSSWDIPNLLLTLSNDKSRVNTVADILATKDPNIVAISLLNF